MLPRSTEYNSIFADPNHAVEWVISINGVDYGTDKIAADVGGGHSLPHLHRQIFTGNSPSVGGCVAATFECSIFEASANVPRMATVVPKYRLTLDNTTPSEWITLGTFYIDTRNVDEINGVLDLYCYDAMLKADGLGGKSYAELTSFVTWPKAMVNVVSEIAHIMGVSLDVRTVIQQGTDYMVEYPNDLTMREVLGYIAAANGGNWCITPANKLRFIPITGYTSTLNVGTNAQTFHTAPAFDPWTKVTMYWSDENAYQAGTDTGRELVCDCIWATQGTANGVLNTIRNFAYQPFSGGGSFIDLALELGDKVTIGYPGETITAPAWTIDITAEVLEVAQISAEGEQEIDHEYPYSDYVDRSLKRKVTLGEAYEGVEITRENGITIERTDGTAKAVFNSRQFEMDALIDGTMQRRIYFDPAKGDYIFDGVLGADAIYTDALYAEQGDIAELTVDRLSTSKRIRKYILGDTSDDNYIRIQDNVIQLITGTVDSGAALGTEGGDAVGTEAGDGIEVQGTPSGAVQATNRHGQPLYWQREPVGHTSEGYPTDSDGVQIYATTEETSWPVYTYAYVEQVKSEYAFEQINGVYNPRIVMGAGDENGYSKGYIYKTVDYLLIQYITPSGDPAEIRMNNDGYVDIVTLRKTAVMDFSGWDSGTFSEVADGGKITRYAVDFNASGVPTRITDDTGHVTEVVW